jgi:hypothetical protein
MRLAIFFNPDAQPGRAAAHRAEGGADAAYVEERIDAMVR